MSKTEHIGGGSQGQGSLAETLRLHRKTCPHFPGIRPPDVLQRITKRYMGKESEAEFEACSTTLTKLLLLSDLHSKERI